MGAFGGGARYARGRFEEMGGLFGKVYNLDKEGGEKEGEGPHTPPHFSPSHSRLEREKKPTQSSWHLE